MPTAASLALDGSHYFNDCWEHSAAFVTSPPLRDDPEIADLITAAVADDDYQVYPKKISLLKIHIYQIFFRLFVQITRPIQQTLRDWGKGILQPFLTV